MITIEVKTALVYLLLIAVIVLVVYLIIMAKHLITTVKETNKILEDASVISGVAADKAVQLDEIVGDVQSAVSDLSQAVKGQQNVVGSISNFAKAVGSLVAIFKTDKAKKAAPKKRKK